MNICQMDAEEIVKKGVLALLQQGPMDEPELYKALAEWHGMVIQATLVQMVLDEKVNMSWQNGKLYFSYANSNKS